mgnify:CR=1 FL=1
MAEDNKDLLQHPRRHLGNRYRSQAKKFVKLATMDDNRFAENIEWAEQSARQAILYDFTDENNWRCLADIKVMISDGYGLIALIEDLFSILGRDAEQIEQLNGVDFEHFGLELIEAAFARDPLNPDVWWERINSENSVETLNEFVERCHRLDFTDPRANIIFARRIERIRDSGHEELFIQLARNLLAHRPQNYELWMELGRLYERLSKPDEAWICYDHVQTLRPHSPARDEFLQRLTMKMDGEGVKTWTRPPIIRRQEFLDQMVTLASRVSTSEIIQDGTKGEGNEPLTIRDKLDDLLKAGDFSEAFFIARRLVAEGEDWAEEYMQNARKRFD